MKNNLDYLSAIDQILKIEKRRTLKPEQTLIRLLLIKTVPKCLL